MSEGTGSLSLLEDCFRHLRKVSKCGKRDIDWAANPIFGSSSSLEITCCTCYFSGTQTAKDCTTHGSLAYTTALIKFVTYSTCYIHSDEGAGRKMELAGTRPTHARAPPGAPSPVKLRQTYSRDAFRRRTKPKYRKRY